MKFPTKGPVTDVILDPEAEDPVYSIRVFEVERDPEVYEMLGPMFVVQCIQNSRGTDHVLWERFVGEEPPDGEQGS